MSARGRALSLLIAPAVVVGAFTLTLLLPSVRQCEGIWCGPDFDPGNAAVFGRYLFTPAQTVVLALGIWAGASIAARAVLPDVRRWTAPALGVLVLTCSIAIALPSSAIGPAPTTPCSTPGPDGPIAGSCVMGSPPVDDRVRDRALVVAAGLLAVTAGWLIDRRRPRAGSPAATTPVPDR